MHTVARRHCACGPRSGCLSNPESGGVQQSGRRRVTFRSAPPQLSRSHVSLHTLSLARCSPTPALPCRVGGARRRDIASRPTGAFRCRTRDRAARRWRGEPRRAAAESLAAARWQRSTCRRRWRRSVRAARPRWASLTEEEAGLRARRRGWRGRGRTRRRGSGKVRRGVARPAAGCSDTCCCCCCCCCCCWPLPCCCC